MKKIFTLFVIALLGLGQVWAISKTQLTVEINGKGQIAVNTTAAQPAEWSSTAVTKDQSHGTFDIQVTDYYYIWVKPETGYYCSGVSDCSWDDNGYYTISFKGSTTTNKKTVTATFVGNSYILSFDGNGATSGSMANQNFVYGTAQNIRANGFARQFAITYNANGGDCAETEATATASFAGWAKSANGEVVYTDQQSLSTPTPLPAHNSTINLFAQWDAATVVLPEVSREGLLFDGWYNGDVWAGNIGDTYVATADAELTAHWAEKRTPVFVLDKTEIELGQTAQLTMNNVNNPTIEISPAGIVDFNAETGALTGVGVGEATITATQQATDELSYKQEILTLNVTKKTASLSVILDGIEQSSVVIYQGKKTTVSFNKVSDAEVQVEAISGAQCASYKDGVLTAGEIGTAVFRANLPETETYKSTYADFSVETQKDPVHLPMNFTEALWNNPTIKVGTNNNVEWDGDNGVHLGDGLGGGLTYNDKWVTIHFEGIPDKLSFEYSYDYRTEGTKPSSVGPLQQPDPDKMYFLFVEESSDNENWTALTWQDTDPFRNSWKNSGELQLKKATRYVRMHYNANLGAYYRNIYISELKYVQDPVPASVDFGTAIIYTGEMSQNVNVNWCNVAPLSVVSTNPKFAVTPSSFANYDQYGSQQITITYEHTAEIGDFEGDIVISNGNEAYTKTIHVHGATTKREQTIAWNAELAATGFAMNVGEQYPDEMIEAVATVPSGERVIFTSLDPEVVEVIADTALLAKKVGTALIAAYQAGDAEYGEAKDTVLFTVTDLRKQTITWEQNLYGLLTTDDSVLLTANATSGMEITYTSADENVVRIQNDTLIVVGEGETSVTAYQAGGFDTLGIEWLPISLTNYVIVRNPASQCNEMALSVGSMELNADQLSREYDLVGTPGELTFVAKHGTKSTQWGTGASYAALVVEQYAFIDGFWDWFTVYNKVVGTDDTQSGTIVLDESATKIRFATGETATNHTISNIRVPRKKFMRADAEIFDMNVEANATWQQTITVSHSNIDLMSVSTKQGVLSLSANTLGKGCSDFGDDAFVVSFTPKQKYVEYLDTIVITDGKAQPSTIEIPVRLYTTGLNQYIQNFELPEACITSDIVAPFAATATSGLTEIQYLSSDSAIAYAEGNQLVILAAGTVSITAYQAGDDRYNPASLTKTIVIGLTPVEILEAPTASEVAEGATLSMSMLFGGKASVEGSFAWTNAEIVPVNENSYEVTFTPVRNTYYATATTMVPVTVKEQPKTYGLYEAQFCAGDSVEFMGKWYAEATQENILLTDTVNIYGGDSIVILTVNVLPVYAIEEFDTVYVDAEFEWMDEIYPTNELGTFNYEKKFTSIEGCDSIHTLALTVIERPTTYGAYEAQFCDGDSIEFKGVWYAEATVANVLVEEKNIYGGDSIVILTVNVLPNYLFETVDTVYVGDAYEWMDEVYPTNEEGTFYDKKEYKTVNECDSVYTLTLVVIKNEGSTTAIETVEAAQTAVKEFRNGVIYIRREGKEFTTDGQLVK